jgi:hypothetical protein
LETVIKETILCFQEKLLYIHRGRLERHPPRLKRSLAPEFSLARQCMLQQQPTAVAAAMDISPAILPILSERQAMAQTSKPTEPSYQIMMK